MAMPGQFKTILLKAQSDKNVEDIVVFLTWKVFISQYFFIGSYKRKKCTIHFCIETANENKQFKNTKRHSF